MDTEAKDERRKGQLVYLRSYIPRGFHVILDTLASSMIKYYQGYSFVSGEDLFIR